MLLLNKGINQITGMQERPPTCEQVVKSNTDGDAGGWRQYGADSDIRSMISQRCE